MTQFHITDSDLLPLQDKIVVVTGGSSGIGLASINVLLANGAHVVSGDMNDPPTQHAHLTFQKTNVTSWDQLKSLFSLAISKHHRIDHVFSNAGISGRADYLASDYDDAGELLEPTSQVYDINLRGMINTSYLALHHFQHQSPPGGSIVCTASGSSFQPFAVWDYTTTKHGVLGFMRGALPNLALHSLPIRINCIGPSWTITGLVPKEIIDAAGIESQPASVVGRNVAYLMADESRNGEFSYSSGGRYYEIEKSCLLPAAAKACGVAEVTVNEQEAFERISKLAVEAGIKEGQAAKGEAGA
ncbi:Short-chain dehydrogenase/reductase ascJ [Fulvia fulva]|uniref:Short-chain dehydrogenase/reductase ascJ n=1 Tax=Passalora fulva TaxID=5499 RepID=A0A9Q8PAN3_PASFU|nr:Short-chain dehydrogenase/reductase ascJ [Fulvia fulva]KAK4621830.1 Short-chain dehydrogenase/reductase ascJ [Fulvia fulva]KAK4622686.1 Short-chain dehydrogenase/reductase ascJ [Fulvia fulva]UJO18973.1 Short-chain dehydrogenase/reductase ascJ [Fulvia fulva]WPV16560.1 Short-chain dehydrogenase/reductase ascJ [Fulvia fulva]WPV31180.1 Short-chain dehydrogenase/reductase ascJ [Fulvia fulva]